MSKATIIMNLVKEVIESDNVFGQESDAVITEYLEGKERNESNLNKMIEILRSEGVEIPTDDNTPTPKKTRAPRKPKQEVEVAVVETVEPSFPVAEETSVREPEVPVEVQVETVEKVTPPPMSDDLKPEEPKQEMVTSSNIFGNNINLAVTMERPVLIDPFEDTFAITEETDKKEIAEEFTFSVPEIVPVGVAPKSFVAPTGWRVMELSEYKTPVFPREGYLLLENDRYEIAANTFVKMNKYWSMETKSLVKIDSDGFPEGMIDF